MYNVKEVVANRPSRYVSGHRMCSGCGAPPVTRMILRAVKPEDHVVVSNATGCLEVSSFIYPYTSFKDSYIHTAFESAASTASGVEAAYKSLKKQGKLPGDKDTKILVFAGDGGTYDIGFQALSGAMERGHDLTYVCYDNGAYMNTGIQRSSATPKFADTTTTPHGKVIPGKMQERKNITEIMVAHELPYVCQTAAYGNFKDLYEKAKSKNVNMLLPVDVVVSKEFSNDSDFKTVTIDSIEEDYMGLDIGYKTVELFSDEIKKAKTVVWNGPMGVFEMPNFAKGTFEIAKAIAETDSISIIGGGDSASAAEKSGFKDKITHISTGGGASLEFLEGKILPGIDAIDNK